MSANKEFLKDLYEAFNRREIDRIIALMRPDVKWANGMEGGFIDGRERVREYWQKQFETMRPHLEPLAFETDENGRNIVTVRIVINDLGGNPLLEKTVRQIFTIEDGAIGLFEIGETEPVQKELDKLKAAGE